MMSPTASAATRNRASLVRSICCERPWLIAEANSASTNMASVAPTTHTTSPAWPTAPPAAGTIGPLAGGTAAPENSAAHIPV